MRGRVAALVGPEKIQLKDFEVPAPEPGAVVLKVHRANVCGSDVHAYHYESPALRQAVLGHEFVGEIVALGDGVTQDFAGETVREGDRVVVVYFQACRRCAGCRKGRFSLCVNALSNWARPPEESPHFHGAFATHYYVQPGQYFYRVPDGLSDRLVAGANCGLAQVIFTLDTVGLAQGETLVVQGAGGLGLYAAAVAASRGARVFVIDGVEDRLELAKRCGAEEVIDMHRWSTSEARVARVSELSGGADVVLEVTGVASAFIEAIDLAVAGGRVASVGNLNVGKANEVTVTPAVFTRKNLDVRGVLRYDPWYLLKALEFLQIASGTYPLDAITDGADFALDDVAAAIELSAAKQVTRASVVPS